MSRARAIKSRPKKFTDPKWEFIYSPDSLTLDEVAEHWKGYKGCSISRLQQRSSSEHWMRLRAEHKEKMEREIAARLSKDAASERAEQISKARKVHFNVGSLLMERGAKFLQDGKPVSRECPHCKQPITIRLAPADMMRPSDGRAFIKDGVDIQRKGLGLDEAQVNVLQLGEMVNVVVAIIQKHVTDLPTYKAIRYDLLALHKTAEKDLEEVLEAGCEVVKSE